MGLHMLDGLPGPMQLYQLAVPGLEERVRVLPTLQTREQLGAGQVTSFGIFQAGCLSWGVDVLGLAMSHVIKIHVDEHPQSRQDQRVQVMPELASRLGPGG